MSEPNKDITEQPQDMPRTTGIMRELPSSEDPYESDRFAVLPLKMNRTWLFVVVSGLVPCFLVLVIGLGILGVAKMREAELNS